LAWCEHGNVRSRCEICNPHLVEERAQAAEALKERAARRAALEEEERRRRELKQQALDELSAQFPALRRLIEAGASFGGTILFTGSHPHNAPDLLTLVPERTTAIEAHEGDPTPLLDKVTVAVVGERGFSQAALLELIRYLPQTRFLPQPAFVDEVLFGENWWLSRVDDLEEIATWHQGLRFVLEERGSLGPLSPAQTGDGSGELAGRLSPTSFLSELGYSVASGGPSESRRRDMLKRAAERFGRQHVEWYLEGFIDINSRRSNAPAAAIDKWRSDLVWVRNQLPS
jgi:hypothetical protein